MPSSNENPQAWLEHPIFLEIVAFPPFRASPACWDKYRTKKGAKAANAILFKKKQQVLLEHRIFLECYFPVHLLQPLQLFWDIYQRPPPGPA